MKEIILVGTYHFEQHAEVIKDKEYEIERLVEYLLDFNPTKIALEWEMEFNDELNKEYKDSKGNYSLNEIQQIGFKLAQKLQHENVYAVDWTGNLTQEDLDKLNFSVQRYPKIYRSMNILTEKTPDVKSDTNLIRSYQELNHADYIAEIENMYLSFVSVEDEKEEKVGFNFINKWFERELMIFKNVVNIVAVHDYERIFLLIGSDHIWLLKNLFEGRGWKVINPFADLV
ncbi:hypothetical protein IHV12_17430 [Fictibacillus sp. 7GRE50]|uniref:DUF5694 domain-containing protein n=1 Tax=Fictibacillus sp. 7GRE50 TaxID=2745878 RepID=UPI0018CEDA24|nr:DUF5694 domain-containing protein [Fictibacillus sp. 7GRE50]MBH0166706.1 hypothetical protein [Fictibacillus sp. 7GRE50]